MFATPQITKFTVKMLLALMLVAALPQLTFAQKGGGPAMPAGGAPGASSSSKGGSSGSTTGGDNAAHDDSNPSTPSKIRDNYFLRFPVAKEHGPYAPDKGWTGHDILIEVAGEGNDKGKKMKKKKSDGPGTIIHCKSGPVQVWPLLVPCAVSNVPTKRDEGIMDDLFQTFGYPVSDTQFQVIQRYNQNRLLEQLYDPEKLDWLSTSIGAVQATTAANSAANLERNQSAGAIEYAQQYLYNFTSDGGNRWNNIRDKLFVPIAILLLLPGAVAAQVKVIIQQGSPVLGEAVNPFEGIIRSIIAVFMIPATWFVLNYGIDISNSIALSINDKYKQAFHGDMYKDAQCAHARAFQIRDPNSNENAITPPDYAGGGGGNDPKSWSDVEKHSFDITTEDPCKQWGSQGGGGNQDRKDEHETMLNSAQRAAINAANAALCGAWAVMCAFQTCYLLYLFCMGPIVAALWVWPIDSFRKALGSWIEGVVTICFWSLFWNTTILLMACFKGVADTGTVIMTALNYLANICVVYAFKFADLAGSAGQQAAGAAKGAASSGAGRAGAGAMAGHAGAGAGAGRGGGGHGTATAGGGHPAGAAAGGGAGATAGQAAAMAVHGAVMGGGGGMSAGQVLGGTGGATSADHVPGGSGGGTGMGTGGSSAGPLGAGGLGGGLSGSQPGGGGTTGGGTTDSSASAAMGGGGAGGSLAGGMSNLASNVPGGAHGGVGGGHATQGGGGIGSAVGGALGGGGAGAPGAPGAGIGGAGGAGGIGGSGATGATGATGQLSGSLSSDAKGLGSIPGDISGAKTSLGDTNVSGGPPGAISAGAPGAPGGLADASSGARPNIPGVTDLNAPLGQGTAQGLPTGQIPGQQNLGVTGAETAFIAGAVGGLFAASQIPGGVPQPAPEQVASAPPPPPPPAQQAPAPPVEAAPIVQQPVPQQQTVQSAPQTVVNETQIAQSSPQVQYTQSQAPAPPPVEVRYDTAYNAPAPTYPSAPPPPPPQAPPPPAPAPDYQYGANYQAAPPAPQQPAPPQPQAPPQVASAPLVEQQQGPPITPAQAAAAAAGTVFVAKAAPEQVPAPSPSQPAQEQAQEVAYSGPARSIDAFSAMRASAQKKGNKLTAQEKKELEEAEAYARSQGWIS
jgi:hypothetical protein